MSVLNFKWKEKGGHWHLFMKMMINVNLKSGLKWKDYTWRKTKNKKEMINLINGVIGKNEKDCLTYSK